MSWTAFFIVFPIGLLLLVGGLLLYLDVWRGFLLFSAFSRGELGVGAPYFGVFLVAISIEGVTSPPGEMSGPGALLVLLGAACLLPALLSAVWLPRFLLPRWLRQMRDLERYRRRMRSGKIPWAGKAVFSQSYLEAPAPKSGHAA